jgi:chemotaxis protein CheX
VSKLQAEADAQEQDRWIEQIDDAVTEVFQLMLQQRCLIVDKAPLGQKNVSAKIIFSGTLEGHCTVCISIEGAYLLTDALLGAQGDWDESMIDDAVGELCNMIAGGWKSRLSSHASACNLSVPHVSRIQAPEDFNSRKTTRKFYAFEGSVLEVAMGLS